MKKKYKKIIFIGVICCLVVYCLMCYLLPIGIGGNKLYGKWYLYSGNDINTEKNVSTKINTKDYIDISLYEFREYRSDGKNGYSTYTKLGNRIYSGDAIYSYKITNIGEYKVLLLKDIGTNMGHGERFFQDGYTHIYIRGK